jgi:division protein CdvB (Snf7/Vps24/ESCRT-III family)
VEPIAGDEVERKWGASDLISRFFSGIARAISKRENTLRRALEQVLVELDLSYNALEEVARKMQRRYNELYTQALRAVTEKNMARATIYANEMAEIKKIYRRLRIALTFIEQLKLRVGTLSELDKLRPSLIEFQRLLDLLKPQIAPIVPNVAVSLERVMAEINSITGATSAPEPLMEHSVKPDSKEASELLKKIIADADRSVDETLPQMLPELAKLVTVDLNEDLVSLPPDIYAVRANQQKIGRDTKHSVDAAEQGNRVGGVGNAARRIRTPEELDKALLEYIISRGGFLDIEDFMRLYGCSREEVMTSLDRLVKSNKVSVVS